MQTTATSKGQIVIPSEIRRAFGIEKGTRIDIQAKDDGTIVLRPITPDHVGRLRGSMKSVDLVGELERERALDRSREEE